MWIHEHQNWPDFTWNVEMLASGLADLRHRQGRLLGRMEGLGFELKQEATLNVLTSDVVKSSAIEGRTWILKRYAHLSPAAWVLIRADSFPPDAMWKASSK